ncbi:MAG TPA: hypothetical protein VFC15_01470 [Candidatus Limnocylindrales bacterium]|nr:hypothetical protein [Candidatus Limnocylindrales bacterium]
MVIDSALTGGWLGGEGGGGEIHGPEQHSGGGEVDAAGVHDAEDFRTAQGEVAAGRGYAKPREGGEAASAGDVVEASAGVEMMAAADTSSDGGALAVAAVGKSVAAKTDDQVRVHKDLRRAIWSG